MTGPHALGVAAALVGGAAVGLGSGWLAVVLERREGLEAEELEERRVYERERAEAIAAAEAEGKPAPRLPEWESERYGWTWLERWLAPALTAIGWGAFAAHETLGIALVVHLAWLAVLVHVVVFDLKHRLILNRITFPAIAVALAASFVTPDLGIGRALLGAVVVYVFFMAQSLALGGNAIGQGDAKLGAFIGATTGLGLDFAHLGAVYAVLVGVLLGGVVALLLLVTRRRSLRDPIPYGPFLCAGAAAILYVGNTAQVLY